MDLSSFSERRRLEQITTLGELSWTAGILSCFTSELAQFVAERDVFYRDFLHGSFEAAEAKLTEIVRRFGHSIWSIDQKLKLLQASGGLKAQKDYLEEVISTKGLAFMVGWMAYHLSLRAENTTSPAMVEDILAEAGLTGVQSLLDYTRSHISTYDLTLINDPGSVLSLQQSSPIVDQFETFVSMALVHASKGGVDVPDAAFIELLKPLEVVGDQRLSNLIGYLGMSVPEGSESTTDAMDCYTRGAYDITIRSHEDELELCARAHAFLGSDAEALSKANVRDEVVWLMHDVLTATPESAQSVSRLEKIAILYSGCSLSAQIISFLERPSNYVTNPSITSLSKYAILSTSLSNPLNAWMLDQADGGQWLQISLKANEESNSARLQRALAQHDLDLLNSIRQIDESRKHIYTGHIQYLSNDFEAAAGSYQQVADGGGAYSSAVAVRYLYDALFAQGRTSDALDLLVPHLLQNPSRSSKYPLGDLAKRCMKDAELLSSMAFAVLLHLASRFDDRKWERDLSDVYENILTKHGAERPSELENDGLGVDTAVLIYFLRHVCVPRILSDSTSFDSVDEIDSERIAICQSLLTMDAANAASYLSEIRVLTRDAEVAGLLHKIQTSLIYVDEDGLRELMHPAISPLLTRLHILMKSPDIAYQAEKMTKRLEEMLSHSNKGGEFKALSLPATEVAGLFRSMLVSVVSEFAGGPAYGLDTHLSTTIRHGAFEGELRSPLAIENLLCIRDESKKWMDSEWRKELADLSGQDMEHVEKQLQRFTDKFDDLVQVYLKEKLHVRLVGGSTRAMFNFDTKPAQEKALLDSLTVETDYTAFMDKILAFCWQLTSHSLEAIRSDLEDGFNQSMNLAFDSLVKGVELRVEHERVASLVDAVARARTAFQVALANVVSWFQLPSDLSREPFDFDLAARIALQQVNNCYVSTPLTVTFDIRVHDMLDGTLLDGICEVLFILFQNVILRSGLEREGMMAELNISEVDGDVVVNCSNLLGTHLDPSEVAAQALIASSRYEKDSALSAARKEGGSGLSKVWRICEFDLGKKSALNLESSEGRFSSTLVLKQLRAK